MMQENERKQFGMGHEDVEKSRKKSTDDKKEPKKKDEEKIRTSWFIKSYSGK
jgi:hypothetical protein